MAWNGAVALQGEVVPYESVDSCAPHWQSARTHAARSAADGAASRHARSGVCKASSKWLASPGSPLVGTIGTRVRRGELAPPWVERGMTPSGRNGLDSSTR